MSAKKAPRIPLPHTWSGHVRSAMLHVLSLAQYATVYTRSWAVDSMNGRVRLKAENDRLRQEIALLREELRIKDARMARIPPHRRPHYPPTERLAILELRAVRGWSLEQTADTFLLTAPTIASWTKRVDEEGSDALVQLRETVNKFPEFVRYVVQRLKTLCPSMGKAVCVFLGWTIRRADTAPKYIICDRDSIFDCDAFRRWVKGQGVQPPRYGAVGKHGSTAVI